MTKGAPSKPSLLLIDDLLYMINDGGVATYTGGSGSNTLTFSYTVLAGQNTPDLMASGFNSNGANITDGAGNSANLSLTGIAQGSPAILAGPTGPDRFHEPRLRSITRKSISAMPVFGSV